MPVRVEPKKMCPTLRPQAGNQSAPRSKVIRDGVLRATSRVHTSRSAMVCPVMAVTTVFDRTTVVAKYRYRACPTAQTPSRRDRPWRRQATAGALPPGANWATLRLLDAATGNGRFQVLLEAVAPGRCNPVGECAAGGDDTTVIWLEIDQDLTITNKQVVIVESCLQRRPRRGDEDTFDGTSLRQRAVERLYVGPPMALCHRRRVGDDAQARSWTDHRAGRQERLHQTKEAPPEDRDTDAQQDEGREAQKHDGAGRRQGNAIRREAKAG